MLKFLFLFIILSQSFSQHHFYNSSEKEKINQVLKKYIYKDFIAYERLSQNDADKDIIKKTIHLFQKAKLSILDPNEKLSFWINLYNLSVIDLVLQNYPIHSINDIPNAFESKFIKVENKLYSLDDIQKVELRRFNDPRYHFAIVCAGMSCPNIKTSLFEANRINLQLEKSTEAFINNRKFNFISGDKTKLSKLFDWYRDEFTGKNNLISFVNRYIPHNLQLSKKNKIRFYDFDWRLNGEITARKIRK